jgi:hypothetical protein
MVAWFLKIAPTLETLNVLGLEDSDPDPGVLSQMLAMAATSAPNLQEIKTNINFRVVGSEILNSIAFLSQTKRLELYSIGIAVGKDLAALQRHSGLRSLQVDFDSGTLKRHSP